ncbi:MAG: ATP-grasp domain-containing protein [Bryobacteraceae bacterium]
MIFRERSGPNVLISSGGRRIALMRAMRESLTARRADAWVGAADAGFSAPIRFLADKFWPVPRCTHPPFADAVLQICRDNGIGLVIPTIDTELPVYARCRNRFEAEGVAVCISSEATIGIAADKEKTHQWLLANDFPTVRQAPPAQAVAEAASWRWPLIAKPRDGSASIGVERIASLAELRHIAATKPACIVQELARGREFTVNLFVNASGNCVCAVPHWRMEVRAGEVSKGITNKNEKLMDLCVHIAETLPGARGPLNVQCFLDEDGSIAIIEINARFGGGYPLAHRAGARFTDWLLDEQEGRELVWFDGWLDDLAMLRYDEAVFVAGKSLTS